MANGLYCSETLPSTPKLRHVSNDSNSENTPPELLSVVKTCDLICNEILDEREIQREKQCRPNQQAKQVLENFNHIPVESKIDPYLLNDDRVLQNLLRNEERYLPSTPDYFQYVQSELKVHMREKVVEWMFQVCTSDELQLNPAPEVFTLAVNFLDRFLAVCRIKTSQFQLLASSCIFLASKFKAVQHISSDMLVYYTDYSITNTELKEWELLILQKLRWELSSTTAMDFLDHVIPRLYLPPAVDLVRLRKMTETVICFAAHDYNFTYKPASMLAAAGIMFSLQNCMSRSVQENRYSAAEFAAVEKITREARTCLQIITHAGGHDLDTCVSLLDNVVPDTVTGRHVAPEHMSPDSTVVTETCKTPDPAPQDHITSTPSRSSSSSSYYSATDLFTDVSSTSTSQPFITSAVDVFAEFNSSVLDTPLSPSDPYSSILLSL